MLAAVSEVDLDVARGRVTGVVGESGCGKSTLARLVLRLLEATSAAASIFDGIDLTGAAGPALRTLRRRMQMVFQDPYSSIDPRYTVGRACWSPAGAGCQPGTAAQDARVASLMAMVGLNPSTGRQLPAPALRRPEAARRVLPAHWRMQPDFLVLDEPTASLDVSIQAQIIGLLEELQQRPGPDLSVHHA